MNQNNDNFSFFVDDVTLEKSGKDKKGNDIMKIAGIASTVAKDADGEEIDVNGWDVSYFVKNGFLNYNHTARTNPLGVIGEPTMAKKTPKGIYIEGFLYNDNTLAKGVYDTTKMLQKSSSSRRMGFSIEGKALERDPMNPKRITKAKLTGCALTLNPKNPNTLVDIVKGEGHEDALIYDYKDVPEEIKSTLEKSEAYIIHLERDGKVVQVDKDLNIKITEKIGTEDIDKSMSTTSAAAVTVESVDQDVKSSERLPKVKKNLSKGEVYSEIFNYIVSDDLEKADLMYKLIKATATKRTQMETNTTEKVELTKEDIQKSINIVMGVSVEDANDLNKSTDADDLEKGKKDKPETDEEYQAEMEKAMDGDEEYQKLKKAMDAYKEKIEKGEISGYPAKPSAKDSTMQEDENAASIGKEGEFIKKSEVVDLIKSVEGTLEAAIEKNIKETTDLIKSLGEAAQGLLNKNDDLQKSLDGEVTRNDEIKKSLDAVTERLETVENMEIPSRTVNSQTYMKHPNLEKSQDGGSKQLHIKNDKAQILDIMEGITALDSPKPDMNMAKAMMSYESSNALEKSTIASIKKAMDIDIIG